jgi:hypothetical protein
MEHFTGVSHILFDSLNFDTLFSLSSVKVYSFPWPLMDIFISCPKIIHRSRMKGSCLGECQLKQRATFPCWYTLAFSGSND